MRRRGEEKHHIDFADVVGFFSGSRFEWPDERHVAIGRIAGRVCVCAYTMRGPHYRVISLRRANTREQTRYWRVLKDQLGPRG